MKSVLVLTVIALLAACGADGPPVAPSQAPAEPTPEIAITGQAQIGIVGGN